MPKDRRQLCLTCAHGPVCMYRGDLDRRVFECDDYWEAAGEPSAGRKQRRASPVPQETRGSLSEGLCSDCQNRQQCAWRMPEGGVWHCEEYC